MDPGKRIDKQELKGEAKCVRDTVQIRFLTENPSETHREAIYTN